MMKIAKGWIEENATVITVITLVITAVATVLAVIIG